MPGADPGCQTGPVLSIGVVALGVGDVGRAAAFWCEALGYEIRTDGFGGWAAVLTPPAGGAGTKIALQRNETPPQDHPRVHLDLHVSSSAEQTAGPARLMALGARTSRPGPGQCDGSTQQAGNLDRRGRGQIGSPTLRLPDAGGSLRVRTDVGTRRWRARDCFASLARPSTRPASFATSRRSRSVSSASAFR